MAIAILENTTTGNSPDVPQTGIFSAGPDGNGNTWDWEVDHSGTPVDETPSVVSTVNGQWSIPSSIVTDGIGTLQNPVATNLHIVGDLDSGEIIAKLPADAVITQITKKFHVSWEYGTLINCTPNIFIGGVGSFTTSIGSFDHDIIIPVLSISVIDFINDPALMDTDMQFLTGATRAGGVNASFTLTLAIYEYTVEVEYTSVSSIIDVELQQPDEPTVEVPIDFAEAGMEIGQGDQEVLVLSVDVSGIYQIIPGKRNDTIYDRPSGGGDVTTEDVTIPRPFGKMGFVGG